MVDILAIISSYWNW